MNKIILGVMCICIMASCSKNEIINSSDFQNHAIEFGKSYLGLTAETKAGGLFSGTTLPTDWDFCVSAWDYRGTTGRVDLVIDNDTVSYVNPNWMAKQKYYWPIGTTGDTKMNFVAYAPKSTLPGSFKYATAPTITKTGVVANDITVDVNPSNQVDFLYSLPIDFDKTKVKIGFKHAMTQLVFNCYTFADYEVVFKVTNITLKGVVSKGNVTTTATNATWTLSTDKSNYLVNKNTHVSGRELAEKDAKNDNNNQFGDNFLMIPQGLSDDVTVDITVEVNGIEYKYENLKLKTMGTTPITSWSEGKKVIYNICFKLDTIEFDQPSVTDRESDNVTTNP